MVRDFYDDVVIELLRDGVLDTGMRVLVVCGGRTDRLVMERCGFRDVVISNLGVRPAGRDLGSFGWSEQDSERLGFDDESFDFVVVHSGLHHCYFVYRFTEREIVKTVHSYAPYARHDIRFFYRMRIPWGHLRLRRNRGLYLAVRLARPVLKLVEVCAPRQSNNFAALILKPDLSRTLHPWLRRTDGAVEVNSDWLATRYRTITAPRPSRQRS